MRISDWSSDVCSSDLPNAGIEKLVEYVQGPDFPTGGLLVEPLESRIEAYRTGRGSFRHRARWQKEELPRGPWQIVVTELPYQVQKSRLIEKLAELRPEPTAPRLNAGRAETAQGKQRNPTRRER